MGLHTSVFVVDRFFSGIIERFRIAQTANGNREIHVDVFLRKKMSAQMRIVQNNPGLAC